MLQRGRAVKNAGIAVDFHQHGLGSKPTRAILLCPWEKHFKALSSAL